MSKLGLRVADEELLLGYPNRLVRLLEPACQRERLASMTSISSERVSHVSRSPGAYDCTRSGTGEWEIPGVDGGNRGRGVLVKKQIRDPGELLGVDPSPGPRGSAFDVRSRSLLVPICCVTPEGRQARLAAEESRGRANLGGP